MRRTLSPTARVNVFKAANGLCHLCGVKIQVGETWEVEHVVPIALGGSDTPENMKPAHKSCHRQKTTQDASNIARAKRREARHIGAATSRNPLPGGRNSKWKKKLSGEVVPR